jgi:mono/diheme cytochrome c family protein
MILSHARPTGRQAVTSGRATTGLVAACVVLVLASPAKAQTRGELLYSTHCVACHTTQIHWRDQKLATDWGSLLMQVRRWQASNSLGWNEDDIIQVARHLNESIYRFPRPQALMGAVRHSAQL